MRAAPVGGLIGGVPGALAAFSAGLVTTCFYEFCHSSWHRSAWPCGPTRLDGDLPVDLSGSWARDWARSDNVGEVWRATLARLPAARGSRGGFRGA